MAAAEWPKTKRLIGQKISRARRTAEVDRPRPLHARHQPSQNVARDDPAQPPCPRQDQDHRHGGR